MHALLELFTQSESADTGGTRDAEEYRKDSETNIRQCSFPTVGHILLGAIDQSIV